MISSPRTNKHLGQAVEIKFNWVYFLKETMGLEMLKSCLQFLVWPHSWHALFPQVPVLSHGPWGPTATPCHPVPPRVTMQGRTAEPTQHRPCGTVQASGILSALHRVLRVLCSSFSDFCGKFHWKRSIQMENVYNIETDPFLIRESVGVEGCSAQNTSTNSA